MTIGERIRRKRLAEGKSQLDLVNALKLSGIAVVSRWENGHTIPDPIYKHTDRLMEWLDTE